jgi:hypothetical protein
VRASRAWKESCDRGEVAMIARARGKNRSGRLGSDCE